MGFSTSGAFAVIGFAILLSTAAFVGVMQNNAELYADAREDDVTEWQEQGETAVEISDTNLTLGQLVFNVTNTGGSDLAVDHTDVLVNGSYYPQSDMDDVTVEGVDTDVWRVEDRLRIALRSPDPTRVKVVTEHGVAALQPLDLRRTRVSYVADGDGSLRTVTPSGAVETYATSATVDAVGPATHDVDDDGRVDVPYVTASDELRMIDDGGEETVLDPGGTVNATHLGVGDWDADGTVEVVYVRGQGTLTDVEPDGTATTILSGAASVAGVGDFDDDGDQDVVYVDSAGELRYVDAADNRATTGVTVSDENATGRPADYDGDGLLEVPHQDGGDQGIDLANDAGADGTFTPSYQVSAASMGAFDWDGDGTVDVVHVDGSNELRALDARSGDTWQIFDSDGAVVVVQPEPGAA
ncbi:hypothetical protein VB773_17715 [Haloarculaceae archaeon H-GB2-1]|nr:hypothetical protein [Haloarculaceae archaeon H-GB2-1]